MKELLKKKVLKSNLCRLSKSLHCKFLFKNLVSSLLGIGRLKLIQSGRCFLWLLFRYFKKDKAIVLIYSYESLLQYISQLLLACFGFVCLFVVLHRNNSGLDSTRKNLGWGKYTYICIYSTSSWLKMPSDKTLPLHTPSPLIHNSRKVKGVFQCCCHLNKITSSSAPIH